MSEHPNPSFDPPMETLEWSMLEEKELGDEKARYFQEQITNEQEVEKLEAEAEAEAEEEVQQLIGQLMQTEEYEMAEVRKQLNEMMRAQRDQPENELIQRAVLEFFREDRLFTLDLELSADSESESDVEPWGDFNQCARCEESNLRCEPQIGQVPSLLL